MAGRIPDDIIEQVLSQTDIVSLVSRYVRLERKGSANLFGLCPFHSEKTPSFSVTPAKQIFYCFGCHKGGNAIKFISEIEHLSFPESVRLLAEELGIEVRVDEDDSYRQRREEERVLREVLLESARFFFRTISVAEGNHAKKYLRGRGISEATMRTFGLGFAPKAWDRLSKHLLKTGFSEAEAIAAGMSQRSSQGTLIDTFRNRLMIPIFDFVGQIVAFGGRAMGDEKAKYINSKETALYKKGRHLFAMNIAKKNKESPFIVAEGYFDVISLHAAGFDTAIGLLGTAMSTQQAQLLAQMDRSVTLCLDADDAGIQAAMRAAELLKKRDVRVSIVLIPSFKDPDLYIQKKGAASFKQLLKSAQDDLDFKLDIARRQATNERGELDIYAYQRQATDILLQEENAVLRELKADKVAKILQTSPAAVLEEVARKKRKETTTERPAPPPKKKKRSSDLSDEVFVLIALTDNPKLWQHKGLSLDPEDFSQDGFRAYLAPVERAIKENRYSFQTLLAAVEREDPELLPYLLAAAAKATGDKTTASEKLYQRAVIGLKMRRYERERDALLASLEKTHDQADQETLGELLKEASAAYNRWRQKRV